MIQSLSSSSSCHNVIIFSVIISAKVNKNTKPGRVEYKIKQSRFHAHDGAYNGLRRGEGEKKFEFKGKGGGG